MKYEAGQIVRLRSGGPDMTVVSVTSSPYEGYKCSWFNLDGGYSVLDFDVAELTANDNSIGFNKKE